MQAITLFFNHSGDFIRFTVICSEPQLGLLQATAERIKYTLTAPAHVCQCEQQAEMAGVL